MKNLVETLSLLFFGLSLAGGQLLFKQAGMSMRGQPFRQAVSTLLGNPTFYSALFIYALSALLWTWILSRVPLSRAYPWAAIGMIVVPLIGWRMFGEKVPPFFWLGSVLIFIGLILTQYSANAR